MSGIQDFIAQVKQRGIARTNRYEVMIDNFPMTTANGTRLISLFCEAVNLPGINMSTTAAKVYGEERQMPYEPVFDPVTLTFYVDAGMEVKFAFERWMGSVYNPLTRAFNYYKDYTRDVTIKVYNVADANPYTLKLFEAYPKTMQAVQLSAESKDVMKLTVNLQYKYWYSDGNPMLKDLQISPVTPQNQDPQSVNTNTGYMLRNLENSKTPPIGG